MSLHNEKNKKRTAPSIMRMKKHGEKVSMLTAYDALMAEIVDSSGVDIILVGDSAGMVMAGKENTVSVTMEEMLFYTRSVSQAVNTALLIADMPFLSYQINIEDGIRNAGRFLQEAGAEGVKVEGGQRVVPLITKLVEMGIPVMGHLGLTPQSVHTFGGFGLQGKEEAAAAQLKQDALALQNAGVFSIVLEKIPADLATEISKSLNIPTIGIGAGSGCDGQVLVTHDMLGMYRKFKPKFARRYLELGNLIEKACRAYINDVKEGQFPNEDESY